MRILLLTHLVLPSLGGVQRSVANLARLLEARGHDVSLASHHPWALLRPSGRSEGVEHLRLAIPPLWPDRPGPRAAALDALSRRRLVRWCRQRGIEVIHSHLINADTRYAFAAAAATGARVVVTLRGGETEHWLARPRRREYVAGILERADHVTAVAAALLDQARALCPGLEARSTVVPNPVEPDRIRALARGPADVEPYFLFVGRLEPMKDVATLIDAYHALGDDAARPSLAIVGTGTLEAGLRERAMRGAGRDGIRFLGRSGHAETLALIRGARALVLPSRSSEGCPNAALEAMALGTPLVVSDLPALRELVSDGAAGAVFPRGDRDALRDRLTEVLVTPDVVSHRIRFARERVATVHDPGRVLQGYEAIYERVVVAGPRPSARSSRS